MRQQPFHPKAAAEQRVTPLEPMQEPGEISIDVAAETSGLERKDLSRRTDPKQTPADDADGGEEDYTARLLSAKRRARRQTDEEEGGNG